MLSSIGSFVMSVSSWTGVSPDWGTQQRPSRPILSLLCTSPKLQQSLSSRLRPDEVWFALSRRSALDRQVKQLSDHAGQVITVYKRGSQVAASQGSFRSGKLKAIQSKEDWCVWARKAAIQTRGDEDACGEVGHEESNGHGDLIHAAMMKAQVCIGGHAGDPAETGRIRARLRKREDMVRRLKQKADSICLTADGVVPLDLACPSSREALLGPAGAAY